MDIFSPRMLREKTARILERTPNEKALVLVWAGGSALASLLVSLLIMLLDNKIAETGGISGIQLRGVLSTAQSVLNILVCVCLLFWSFGYIFAMLRVSRGQAVQPASLMEGFRRVGPCLRLSLLEALIYAALAFACMQASSILCSFTPLAQSMHEQSQIMLEAMESGVVPDAATMETIYSAMLPAMIGGGVLFVGLLVPVSYRLRMARLLIMDESRCGAWRAVFSSIKLTKGHCMALVRLDLSYWWFYLGEVLVVLLCYGDLLLPALGVSLPISEVASTWLFYALGLAAQVVLYCLARNKVTVAYALFYDACAESAKTEILPQ